MNEFKETVAFIGAGLKQGLPALKAELYAVIKDEIAKAFPKKQFSLLRVARSVFRMALVSLYFSNENFKNLTHTLLTKEFLTKLVIGIVIVKLIKVLVDMAIFYYQDNKEEEF